MLKKKYCIIGFGLSLFAAASTGYYAKKPKTAIIDYNNKTYLKQIWNKFPDDLKYNLVADELCRLPNQKLYSMGKHLFISKFSNNILQNKKQQSKQNIQNIYDFLKNYKADKK